MTLTDTKPTVSDEVRSSFDLSRFEEHTPGKWWISYLPPATGLYVWGGEGDDEHIVAAMAEFNEDGTLQHTFDNCGANAVLIAAAPDLLSRVRTLEAALREIQDFTGALEDDDPMSHVYVVARQALGGHDA